MENTKHKRVFEVYADGKHVTTIWATSEEDALLRAQRRCRRSTAVTVIER